MFFASSFFDTVGLAPSFGQRKGGRRDCRRISSLIEKNGDVSETSHSLSQKSKETTGREPTSVSSCEEESRFTLTLLLSPRLDRGCYSWRTKGKRVTYIFIVIPAYSQSRTVLTHWRRDVWRAANSH